MKITPRRTSSAIIAGAAIALSLAAVAGPAQASTDRRPAPAPVATSVPTPAPTATPIAVTGTVTHLGTNFSAGGYALVTYSVKVATAGTYAVKYTVDLAGSGVNTKVDGVSLNQIVVGAEAPVSTSTFTLSAGVHTIGTQSPDGYGSTSIDLVRVR